MTPAKPSFTAASQPSAKRTPFAYAFDNLISDIKKITAGGSFMDPKDLNPYEPQLREAFVKFLQAADMPLAMKNFEALLAEKSGKKFLRNDGSVNWFHEFIPLLRLMELGRMGRKNGGFDLKELDPYGGMETLICSHLRHDSIEDFKSKKEMIREQVVFINYIRALRPDYDKKKADFIALSTVNNVQLMSQLKIERADGTFFKEDVEDYIYRMLTDKDANPIVFMAKQADICHNFATLFAPKFTAEKRLKRCNEREDMYGSRYTATDNASEKWEPFRRAIKTLDSDMGALLYPHFRYIVNVDLYYKTPKDYPLGQRYLHDTLNTHLPESVNMFHMGIKNMLRSVDPAEDPAKYDRLQAFIPQIIMPRLAAHKSKFRYLFERYEINHEPAQPSVALN